MNNIISSNPDTWPEVIRNKYGINIDEHFWENNPLLMEGSGADIHKWIGSIQSIIGSIQSSKQTIKSQCL